MLTNEDNSCKIIANTITTQSAWKNYVLTLIHRETAPSSEKKKLNQTLKRNKQLFYAQLTPEFFYAQLTNGKQTIYHLVQLNTYKNKHQG